MGLFDLANKLYGIKPDQTLYHYTSLRGMLGVVPTKSIWATEVRYFNDAAEIKHAAELIDIAITHEQTMGRLPVDTYHVRLFGQLREWLSWRLANDRMLFVACFTGQGNLLSQWRGYCPPGKGVSLGFSPDSLCAAASKQALPFRIGRCVYDREEQLDIIVELIGGVIEHAKAKGESARRVASVSFYDAFDDAEDQLLQVMALLKNKSFTEEQEWRAVSATVRNSSERDIEYREGTSSLIPFVRFRLPTIEDTERLDVDRVIVGPTPNMVASVAAVQAFLSQHGATPRNRVWDCEIPYRTW